MATKIFILIIMISQGAWRNGGVAIEQVEFVGYLACNTAKEVTLKGLASEDHASPHFEIKAVCVEKGEQ